MATREPKKKSDKVKTHEEESSSSQSVDDWLDNISTTKNSPTQMVEDEQTEESPKIDQLLAEFIRELPSWVNKPWMYVKPTHEGHLANWLDSWKQLILKYTTIFSQHVIIIYDIQQIHPFTNKSSGKDLSLDELICIIDNMVEENLAKWLDNDNKRARIYFRTDSEWADILYQFTLDQGYATDIMTLYELQNLEQKWSSLPDNELRFVLDVLVEQNKAEWIGKEKDTIQFKI